MRIRWFILLCVLALAPGTAEAVSVDDIIALTRAGLGDEVLVALVETGGAVYTLSPERVIELKRAGVSERVIVVMLRQGRTPPAGPAADASPPAAAPSPLEPIATESGFGTISPSGAVPGPAPTVVVVTPGLPYPVFVPGAPAHCVRTSVTRPVDRSGGFGRFINDGFRTGTPIRVWGPTTTPCVRKGRR